MAENADTLPPSVEFDGTEIARLLDERVAENADAKRERAEFLRAASRKLLRDAAEAAALLEAAARAEEAE